jgi:hypothetical protein
MEKCPRDSSTQGEGVSQRTVRSTVTVGAVLVQIAPPFGMIICLSAGAATAAQNRTSTHTGTIALGIEIF